MTVNEFIIAFKSSFANTIVIAHNNKYCNSNNKNEASYTYVNEGKCHWCNKPFPETLKILIEYYE